MAWNASSLLCSSSREEEEEVKEKRRRRKKRKKIHNMNSHSFATEPCKRLSKTYSVRITTENSWNELQKINVIRIIMLENVFWCAVCVFSCRTISPPVCCVPYSFTDIHTHTKAKCISVRHVAF